MTKFLLAVIDNSGFQMQVAHSLLANELPQTINKTIMPKKTAKKTAKKATKKTAKKAVKKATKKTTTKKAVKKVAKKAAKKAAPKSARSLKKSQVQTISHEQISHAAYLNYLSRSEAGIHGDQAGDWLAAEASLRNAKK